MPAPKFSLIGRGVYSLPEAARLTKIPPQRIRRWMEGSAFRSGGKRHRSQPIVSSSIGRHLGQLALTFQDLIEVRFLDRFLQHGVKWKEIRLAAERATDLLSNTHPFSTRSFKTDGRSIIAEIASPGGLPALLHLVRDQHELERVVSPLLYAGLEFDALENATRWWPINKTRSVVIDPRRCFGAPIVSEGGVPTAILARSAKADGSQKMAAEIYEVPVRAVRHAVHFETRFLAS
jgi:uncharacterized protein (DUF433 family)